MYRLVKQPFWLHQGGIKTSLVTSSLTLTKLKYSKFSKGLVMMSMMNFPSLLELTPSV